MLARESFAISDHLKKIRGRERVCVCERREREREKEKIFKRKFLDLSFSVYILSLKIFTIFFVAKQKS